MAPVLTWERLALNSACFQAFLQQFGDAYPDSLNVLITDNALAYTAHALSALDNVALLYLPPYCPEFNPVVRLWQDLKRPINVFDAAIGRQLQTLREHIAVLIPAYSPEQLRSLTAYPFILHALNAL